MITVAWSLSYEMFFYLTIPLLVGMLRMRAWTSMKRDWFFLLLAAWISVGGALAVFTSVSSCSCREFCFTRR